MPKKRPPIYWLARFAPALVCLGLLLGHFAEGPQVETVVGLAGLLGLAVGWGVS